MRKFFLSLTLLSLFSGLEAQDKTPVKFGKISADDFKNTVYSIDSNAAAVVIADVGFSYYEGNERGWFTFYHEHQKRVHILKKSGYDAADVQIPLYVDGSTKEDLQGLKAYTYNYENGKMEEFKLDNKNVFTDVVDKNHILKKFTFPNVKEGSIIEFSYKIRSDYWHSPTNWFFQGKYPVLWSELEFHIPEFFYFVFITEGYNAFYKKQPPALSTNVFNVTLENLEAGSAMQRETRKIEAQVFKHRWVIKDAPGIKPEKFTSSILNHISKIEFQLSEIRRPLTYTQYMQTWPMFTDRLLMSEYFGSQLNNANNWMDDELKNLKTKGATASEKAKIIYDFIRDNFTCIDYSARYINQNLKNVLKSKKGNVAEINLLLVAMLKNAGIAADPVLLSTRDHGYTYSMYPLEDKFNYVIAMANIESRQVFMDATRPRLKLGMLPSDCYNGFAVVVNKTADQLTFNPDSLNERKVTMVFITNQNNGSLSGTFQQVLGDHDSYDTRNQIMTDGLENYFNNINKSLSALDIKMGSRGVDSLKILEEPLKLNYDFEIATGSADILYFDPMINEGYKENPFKSPKRYYPVEMPYAIDEIYVFRMETPNGYDVEELPKSIKINLDEEGTSFFEYIVGINNNTISMRTRIKIMRTYYSPEEYDILRTFFDLIVNKQSEQIVFKKKK